MNSKISKKGLWTGRILVALTVLFLLFDSLAKVFGAGASVEGTVAMGYAGGLVMWLGVLLFGITVLYVIPRTAVLGAVLLTGWLGGAVASHIISGEGWFWFPVVFGALAWFGLWLKDERVRNFLWKRREESN
jgi:hypothetical protein